MLYLVSENYASNNMSPNLIESIEQNSDIIHLNCISDGVLYIEVQSFEYKLYFYHRIWEF